MKKTTVNTPSIMKTVIAVTALTVLYFIQLNNYLLFHGLTEIFSIIIAFCIFIISWNGRRYLHDNSLAVIGTSYLFIAFLDILHTLGYNGMGVFRDYQFYANQLWIAARGLESVSLFTAFSLSGKKERISFSSLLAIYLAITSALLYSIFFSDIFPVCFIEGKGQTEFKIISEYIIISILAGSMIQLYRKRSFYSGDTFRSLAWSIIFTVISELSFTFYVSNYGFSNMVGHYSKIISFYFIYKAIVIKSIQEPYDLIFHELTRQRESLQKSDRLKTGLFSIISHDLLSPFSGVASLLQLLDDEFDSFPRDELKASIGDIRRSVDSTSLLLFNLLNWSRLEMGGHQLRKSTFQLKELIRSAAEPLLPLYEKKGVAAFIDIPSSIQVHADRDTLLVVARNILSNALKFSYPGSEVRVEVVTEKNFILVSFEDRGTGMELTPDMFSSPVMTSKSGTLDEKGSGLGLNLIRRYTEENGGTVHIESTPGSGSKITLRFPAVAD